MKFALSVLLAVTLAPSAAAASPAPIDYVALGDSYSSGVGTVDASGTCGRSPSSYPALWAVNHPFATLHFDACGGATTDHVRASQLNALNGDTDLVSITIGGNDVGFSPTLSVCTAAADATCTQQVTTARTAMAQALPAKLDATYQAIRQKAPNAKVVVLGYPRLFNPAVSCPGGGLSVTKQQSLNAAADHLTQVISDRARAAGFTFVDVRPLFSGHEICTAVTWINNVSQTRPYDSYHPNAGGYAQAYLPLLTAAADIGV
ncbi:SGNH/GDSL hydrolase family protein [Paractinoplanes rishiriensis]|uniref:Lipase 1 n=1 Tax=Paractinoplanes rishiriensis TaxID=1050105 RepID=A0A919N1Y3_9ACTN|nr:SGNH/GDSL hydrolase family protein [Actinoplanes rishiriensis]GIE98122.1 lipase 1 [Actinoplanes rishiriensis]